MQRKVIVIGLDGATWRLLDPMIAEGKLPNIGKLRDTGISSKLMSSSPPTTFPAWKCYSTGKNPGKLGVFGMFHPDFRHHRISVPNSRSFRGLELWDHLGENDYRVGIINMPTTEPVKKVNGFMVGGPFSSSSGYTYPRELEAKLVEKYGYRPFLDELVMADQKEEHTDAAKSVIESRFRLVMDEIKRDELDFIHVTIFHIDTLQHFIWGSPQLADVWQYIDGKIGELMVKLDQRWTVLLISDHGFGKTQYKFFVNNWLIRQGLLHCRYGRGSVLARFGLSSNNVYKIVNKLRIKELLKKIFSLQRLRKLARLFPTKDDTVEILSLDKNIDWDGTRALNNNYSIYVNANSEKERRKIIRRIEKALARVVCENGKKPVEGLLKREEVYMGPYSNKGPDIIILPTEGFEPKSTISLSGDLFHSEMDSMKAHHRMEGIFVMNGRGIGPRRIEQLDIIDVAPTILNIFNVDIPEDMDGRAIE